MYTHWSRVLAMFSLLTIAVILVVLKVLDAALSLVQQRVNYLSRSDAPDAQQSAMSEESETPLTSSETDRHW